MAKDIREKRKPLILKIVLVIATIILTPLLLFGSCITYLSVRDLGNSYGLSDSFLNNSIEIGIHLFIIIAILISLIKFIRSKNKNR